MTLQRWQIYFVHLATSTVSQNCKIPCFLLTDQSIPTKSMCGQALVCTDGQEPASSLENGQILIRWHFEEDTASIAPDLYPESHWFMADMTQNNSVYARDFLLATISIARSHSCRIPRPQSNWECVARTERVYKKRSQANKEGRTSTRIQQYNFHVDSRHSKVSPTTEMH